MPLFEGKFNDFAAKFFIIGTKERCEFPKCLAFVVQRASSTTYRKCATGYWPCARAWETDDYRQTMCWLSNTSINELWSIPRILYSLYSKTSTRDCSVFYTDFTSAHLYRSLIIGWAKALFLRTKQKRVSWRSKQVTGQVIFDYPNILRNLDKA